MTGPESPAPADPSAARAWADFAWMSGAEAADGEWPDRRLSRDGHTLSTFGALATAPDAEPALRAQWARAVANYFLAVRTVIEFVWTIKEEAASGALLDRVSPHAPHLLSTLGALAAAHRDEPALREAWAKAAHHYVHDRAAAAPDHCAALLDRLSALAAAHADEPALRGEWAKAVFHYIIHRATAEPGLCIALLDRLGALAAAHADEPVLRAQWANAVANYVHHRAYMADINGHAIAEPDLCVALLDRLRAVAVAHEAEPVPRERWVAGWGMGAGVQGLPARPVRTGVTLFLRLRMACAGPRRSGADPGECAIIRADLKALTRFLDAQDPDDADIALLRNEVMYFLRQEGVIGQAPPPDS
jgi:hypothetical protein